METYKTSNMALVAYLEASEDIIYQDLEKRRDKCVWIFRATGQLLDLVQDFEEEQARVEPISFMNCVARVRSEMFKFLETPSLSASGQDT